MAQRKTTRAADALAGISINSEKDINHLISWNHGVIAPALQFAKSHLGLYPGIVLRHKHSTPDGTVLPKLSIERGRIQVDHLIRIDDFPEANLVVGLGKTSLKWSGRRLASQLRKPNIESVLPLEQQANLCQAVNTRCGYLQSEEELVACRFSVDASGNVCKAGIMPVPWSRHGAEVLTTDLALWWLGMLEMSGDGSRRLVPEEYIFAINDWAVDCYDDERGWVRRHRYSGFEEPTSPPESPAYQTPSEGNAAAFEAAMGLHMHDWFDLNNDANAGANTGPEDVANAEFDDLVNFDFRDIGNSNVGRQG